MKKDLKYKLSCPHCGCKFIQAGDENVNLEKSVEKICCPRCMELAQACDYFFIENPFQANKGDDNGNAGQGLGGHTELGHSPYYFKKPGILVNMDNPKERYRLCVGEQSVGRADNNKKADVQFKDAPKEVSRKHVTITVRKTADGTYMHTIKNLENLNGTFIDGDKLTNDEARNLMKEQIVQLSLHFRIQIIDEQ